MNYQEALFDYQPEGVMSLEEMKKHEWIVPWSGGKDSTATILLMIENNVPIKKVFNVRMMFDENTPAVLPLMTDFVDKTAEKFRNDFGLNVEIVKSPKTAWDLFSHIATKSSYKYFRENPSGWQQISRGMCSFQKEKPKTQNKVCGKDDYQMIGYGCDEADRFSHFEMTDNGLKWVNDKINGRNQSILVTLGIPEATAYRMCKAEGLLSPHYDKGIKRDGCFFCPNSTKLAISRIISEYPDLYAKINEAFDLNPSFNSTDVVVTKNAWAAYIVKERGLPILKKEDVLKE